METTVTIISNWFLGWKLAENAILFVASGIGATIRNWFDTKCPKPDFKWPNFELKFS